MNAKKQLRDLIDGFIFDGMEREVRPRDIYDQVEPESRPLLEQIGGELARAMLAQMISDRMKRISATTEESHQLELDIPGLPQALTFERDGEIFYIARGRARRCHYMANIALLSRQIDADIRKRDAVVIADQRLEPLREEFGDLPERELLRLEAAKRRAA